MGKTAKITWIVAAALINEAGQVLMKKSNFRSENGNLWGFPSSEVEYDEPFQHSLWRKMNKELDVYLDKNEIFSVAFSASEDDPLIIMLFLCREWTGSPFCLDGADVAWFEPEALQDLAMSPLEIPLARALLDLVKN